MTLAQLDTLAGVENRRNDPKAQHLPPPEARKWGTLQELQHLERRANGRE